MSDKLDMIYDELKIHRVESSDRHRETTAAMCSQAERLATLEVKASQSSKNIKRLWGALLASLGLYPLS